MSILIDPGTAYLRNFIEIHLTNIQTQLKTLPGGYYNPKLHLVHLDCTHIVQFVVDV